LWEIENPWFDEVPLQKEEDFMYLFKKNGQRRRRENQVSLNSHLVERESLG
jgi:hypothetical protein